MGGFRQAHLETLVKLVDFRDSPELENVTNRLGVDGGLICCGWLWIARLGGPVELKTLQA